MFSNNFKRNESSTFVKLTDGGKIVGVFVGGPFEFRSNFKLKTQYPIDSTDYPEKTSVRFKINFMAFTDGKFFPFVFEGSKTTALNLEAMLNKFGMDYMYEISRVGADKKTKYNILPERPLSEREKEDVKKIPLHELKLRDSDPDADTSD